MQITDSLQFLGKLVTVHVERPQGSRHPKFGWTYPINYGHLPDTLSGDGEELDAYVLGVAGPVERFQGRCIAVIRRRCEQDDKLVVVPDGLWLGAAEIRAAVEFQERYFESELLMTPP